MKRMAVFPALFACFVCAGAYAHDPEQRPVPSVEAPFSGLIQEQDVALAFRYLRESLDAAIEGRTPPSPDALLERGEVIANEAKRRGAASARTVLDAIEAILREGVREPPRRPPSSPVQGLNARI